MNKIEKKEAEMYKKFINPRLKELALEFFKIDGKNIILRNKTYDMDMFPDENVVIQADKWWNKLASFQKQIIFLEAIGVKNV